MPRSAEQARATSTDVATWLRCSAAVLGRDKNRACMARPSTKIETLSLRRRPGSFNPTLHEVVRARIRSPSTELRHRITEPSAIEAAPNGISIASRSTLACAPSQTRLRSGQAVGRCASRPPTPRMVQGTDLVGPSADAAASAAHDALQRGCLARPNSRVRRRDPRGLTEHAIAARRAIVLLP